MTASTLPEYSAKELLRQPILVPLLLAVAIHILLLVSLSNAIPTRQVVKGSTGIIISAQLRKLIPPQIQKVAAAPVVAKETPPEKSKIDPMQENITEPEVSSQTNVAIETSMPKIDINSIRDQIRQQLESNPKPAKQSALGRFVAHELPENWTRKAVSYTPGMFKSAELPTKAVVLDSWRGPGGTLNMRTKLPNGNIICSSIEQHNPLDIHSVPIWMHRGC